MAEPAALHEATSLSTYLRVIRRRKWIILACAVVLPLVAYALSARQPAQYQASAQVYLSSEDLAGALTGIGAQYIDPVQLADTQAALAQVPAVAERALKLSRLKNLTPGEVLGSMTVTPNGNTSILTFTATTGNPATATVLATAYAKAFTTYRGRLDSDAVRRARSEIGGRLDELIASGQGSTELATSLRSKDQQLATLQALQTSRTYVIRTADGATQIAPTPRRNAAIGLVLGLILGLGLAFAIEALDTRVRSATEVGERLDLPLLARIPAPPKALAKKDKLVMMAQPSGTSAEAFRMLRTNLEFALLETTGSRVILVSSAVQREGKSTTAANLAIAEARAGRRVVLIDLDLRIPYLERFFGLLHAEGLTEVALGKSDLGSALQRIDPSTGQVLGPVARVSAETNGQTREQGVLDVLVAGTRPPDPGEFVGGRRLSEILSRLRSSYDLILIDTPPILRVGDAMTLSMHADGILVVVKLTSARRPILTELRRVLAASPTRVLGYAVTASRDSKGSGYGYGYDYGGYGLREPDRRSSSNGHAVAPPTNVEQLLRQAGGSTRKRGA